MLRGLIAWAVNNALVVVAGALALAAVGLWSFFHVNVEAYPDPAPPIIEVVAQYPGASAEEVERLVTIPLEVQLSGMPGLTTMRTKSLYGLCHMRNQFSYDTDYNKARQEVLNRLATVSNLPGGVSPVISPMTPTGEMVRYSIVYPTRGRGDEITLPNESDDDHYYTTNDAKAMQDWTLQRVFKRIPRVADVSGYGGTVKRYEVHPDPLALAKYGISLQQVANALSSSNANVGGDWLRQGETSKIVRGIGLLGEGKDPAQTAKVLGAETRYFDQFLLLAGDLNPTERDRLRRRFKGEEMKPPLNGHEQRRYDELRQRAGVSASREAAQYLRDEDRRRVAELRNIVVTANNNAPVKIDQLVDGGPLSASAEEPGKRGVVVKYQTRMGYVCISRRRTDENNAERWVDTRDIVQGIVLLRKNEEAMPALEDINNKIDELNEKSGTTLPGVKLEKHWDLTHLIQLTTHTVQENLVLGMVLVSVILLMFLSNVRTAVIVAVNIPLALLFSFSVLYLRGKSANLLSIGAVDFGIIVDSSVIIVENIYRHLSAGDYRRLPVKNRILKACGEVDKALLFTTLIMVCAFLPLFTMQGPEGQIFGPMAQTYAFALAGALVLALTLAPALCVLLFKNPKPARDNILVRAMKSSYLRQLRLCLKHRGVSLGVLFVLVLATAVMACFIGGEFMPELEEGNIYLRATCPVNTSLENATEVANKARAIMREFPEVELVMSEVGRPDDGTDPSGYSNVEFHVPLKPEDEWPAVKEETGWRRIYRTRRPRTKPEIIKEMQARLQEIIGVDWNFSQYIRDNVMEALSGVKGDNSVKIVGPDLDELERLAEATRNALKTVRGIEDVGVFRVKGQPALELPVDADKAAQWGSFRGDVMNTIQTALAAKPCTAMIEGERAFDVSLRFPERLRKDEDAILKIPVEVTNNNVTPGFVPSLNPTPHTGGGTGVSTSGTAAAPPAQVGSVFGASYNPLNAVPRRQLGDLLYRFDKDGTPDPNGGFSRSGASIISREQGNRIIAVKFSVRGRDLAGAVAEAQEKTADLFRAPYRADWAGEFQQMKEAQQRLFLIVPASLALIFLLLYLAFHSLLDSLLVLSNVVALSLGGVWALFLTGTNFSISAAVGFISIFGVAIMDGLLMVSYFNQLRAEGLPLDEAIMQGAEKRVRPVTMTALTAVFGLLPAALSTRIGSQTQQPLAIVVVGGMLSTLLLTRYLMPVLYSFYGYREPPRSAGGLAH
jgi:cobalt-zinc-cadmium resistance protein CzcA